MPKNEMLIHESGAAGADEAGRGCLAGPVVAAAVILPEVFCVQGLNDSKKLSAKCREDWNVKIKQEASYAISVCSVEEIDRMNILQAALSAMNVALSNLRLNPLKIYIDGNHVPQALKGKKHVKPIIKGDEKYACIAAASILAKVTRDRLMRELAIEYPGYGFEKHFGYGTQEHYRALQSLGPCSLHRKSFRPIRELLHRPLKSVVLEDMIEPISHA